MIGIIAAMAEEAVTLRTHMTDPVISEVAGNIYYAGKIKNTSVVLVQCGIGKVNAAIGTTLLIERFKPDYVINTGTAGGLDGDLKVGDVVISLEVRHHDVDVTVFGYDLGQLPKLPPAFMASKPLVDAAEAAALGMKMNVTKGMIVSGDTFMHEESHIEEVKKNFPQVHAVEMEAAAVAQVCHQFHVPFVIIRALSDIAGKDSPVSFEQFLELASRNSAELILNMIDKLGN